METTFDKIMVYILGMMLGLFLIYAVPYYVIKFQMPDIQYAGTSSQVLDMKGETMPNIQSDGLELQVHNLINDERMANGLKLLSFIPELSEIARLHSQDMADHNYFSHYSLQGLSPSDRAMARNYPCHKDAGNGYYREGIGENILKEGLYDSMEIVVFYPEYDWNTQKELARKAVELWMNSPGHRKNILDSDYDRQGIGIAIGKDMYIYITEDLC